MAEEVARKIPHSLILKDRKELMVSGVVDVDSFDDKAVVAYTGLGELTIRGTNLHISKINLESGDLALTGEVDSMTYAQGQAANQGLFSRLFK